ncbi:hypothetical protein [Cohnella luojiensis]|uniref:DUF948 domain-containing protein n=1 Tax=Cohnella luojiensis TaxID=652876 RepID=A0A4Y8M7K0_9BACL|nr:hypothetical protein [Cohnella luojiensis]TFE31554.1 hypothetical protein E2980_00255 [Cohnella luojiensis]
MAWDLAAYGITFGVMAIAMAFVMAVLTISRSLRRLDRAVAQVSKEAELSMQHCRQLADEARETIAASKKSLEGFATLAEGARALGEAVQTAAQTAVHVTDLYRECLISPFQASSGFREEKIDRSSDLMDMGRKLWSMWKNRPDGKGSPANNCHNPEPSADPSRGE